MTETWGRTIARHRPEMVRQAKKQSLSPTGASAPEKLTKMSACARRH
jgi:hypothetical protein